MVICGYIVFMENNPTHTIPLGKPARNKVGDYRYRGVYIIGKHATNYYAVGRRGKNGNYAYRRFGTLKAACVYVDQNIDLFQYEV